MKWLYLGILGVFIDKRLKKFRFWEKSIYKFLIFSLSSLIFASFLICILSRDLFDEIFGMLIIDALIYGALATYVAKKM